MALEPVKKVVDLALGVLGVLVADVPLGVIFSGSAKLGTLEGTDHSDASSTNTGGLVGETLVSVSTVGPTHSSVCRATRLHTISLTSVIAVTPLGTPRVTDLG